LHNAGIGRSAASIVERNPFTIFQVSDSKSTRDPGALEYRTGALEYRRQRATFNHFAIGEKLIP
jgi:hypothetical protein